MDPPLQSWLDPYVSLLNNLTLNFTKLVTRVFKCMDENTKCVLFQLSSHEYNMFLRLVFLLFLWHQHGLSFVIMWKWRKQCQNSFTEINVHWKWLLLWSCLIYFYTRHFNIFSSIRHQNLIFLIYWLLFTPETTELGRHFVT